MFEPVNKVLDITYIINNNVKKDIITLLLYIY
jgi:hypothetical protein